MARGTTLAIVGTGLIGGSLALALRKSRYCSRVIGISRRASTLARARKAGVIDEGTTDLAAVAAADVVVLASPVSAIITTGEKIAPMLKPQALVTDVGSTKRDIVLRLEKVIPNFVGSHPIAGSEKFGVEYARADLFAGSVCILTPTRNTRPGALSKVKGLWRAAGARIMTMPLSSHDEVLARTSHLPHALAYALAASVPGKYYSFAAGGFKDTTRIAASSPEMWTDIFLSNRAEVLKSLGAFEKQLRKLSSAVRGKDRRSLEAFLSSAQKRRKELG